MSSGVDVPKFDPQQEGEQQPDTEENIHLGPDFSSQPGRLISKLLSPALNLWLRSQIEAVEDLQVSISGGNRQILSGSIPLVCVFARCVIYQGLHLTQVAIQGKGIRINIGQVLKGHPLRLLEPLPVFAQIHLSAADLNASVQAPLLANALIEFLRPLLPATVISARQLPMRGSDFQITLGMGELTLRGVLVTDTSQSISVLLHTTLQIVNGHHLHFVNPKFQVDRLPITSLESFTLDLGPAVMIEEFTVVPDELKCRGSIMVSP